MKEFIKSVLVELHKTCTVDQYGQVSKFNFVPNVFGDKKMRFWNIAKIIMVFLNLKLMVVNLVHTKRLLLKIHK